MVTKSDIAALEAHLAHLEGRPARFRAKGLDSRIPGVMAEIEATRKKLDIWHKTYRWQNEIYGKN